MQHGSNKMVLVNLNFISSSYNDVTLLQMISVT